MAKEPKVKKTAQKQERQPQNTPGDKPNEHELQGKALQMNENTAGGKAPAQSPAAPQQPSGDKPDEQKLHGKALEINDNSLEGKTPARSPALPR
jgi:hypothetical protein